VDVLGRMERYRLSRTFLAPSPRPIGAIPSLAWNVPRINIAARRHSVVHVHGEVASLLCLPALATRPSVVTLHGLNLLRRVTGWRRGAAVLNLRLILRATDRMICVSHAEREQLLDALGSSEVARVVVIPNGLDLPPPPSWDERAAARAELGLADSAVVAISVGALDEPKDPVPVARAAVQTALSGVPFSLLFVGEGPLRSDVERVRSNGGETALRVLGYRSDVHRLLTAADFVVLSSRNEGLPYSLLEGMSLGLPAVVSDAPGCIEAVGGGGIVVRSGDVGGFADAFRRLATDERERLALGQEARKRVAHHFRAGEMVARTQHVYDEVSRRRGKR
jgi:glycosyltransferase involved in cell wall biosynthesis